MLAVAKMTLLLLVFTLPFTKLDVVAVGGLNATATDFVFLIVVAALGIALAKGERRLRWSNAFVVLGAYFALILASEVFAGAPLRALPKLASQAYLLSLPVLIYALVDDRRELRRLLQTWLTATAVTTAIGVGTVMLFVAGVDRAAIDYGLHGFGTLAPGPYPRLETTFTHPAMLCNYLTVSLAILLVCLRVRWIGRAAGYSLLAAILVTAAFTITPGLGGIAALIGIWLFVEIKSCRLAVAALAAGGVLAAAFVAVSVVTPILHPTAPFLVQVPGIAFPLAPSVRLLAWIEAGRSIVEDPLWGAGIGADPIAVEYVAPSGARHVLSDAHNVYLNIAMHSGLLALSAIVALIVLVARRMRLSCLTDTSVVRLGLGFAWLNAFAYQGLTGSYEDARHLWVLFGLFLVAVRLEAEAVPNRVA